jgi:hypothetical protein
MESAVVPVEDVEALPSSPKQSNGLKRQRSAEPEESTENESKRLRTNGDSLRESPQLQSAHETEHNGHGKKEGSTEHTTESPKHITPNVTDAVVSTQSAPRERRKASVADEKQRSKRLFGALLGNLNQPGGEASRRRQEIESRRKAELQKQDEEREEEAARRREENIKWRRKVQGRVDEEEASGPYCNISRSGELTGLYRCAYGTTTCGIGRGS